MMDVSGANNTFASIGDRHEQQTGYETCTRFLMCKGVAAQMHLFIVRHGEYVRNGSRDPPISASGMKQASEAGVVITQHSRNVRAVYTSPVGRAVMTADIVSGIVGAPRIVLDCLEPEADPDGFIEVLRETADSDVVVVGHLPNLKRIFSLLCSTDNPELPHFECGGVTSLELLQHGEFNFRPEWTLTSDQVGKLSARHSK